MRGTAARAEDVAAISAVGASGDGALESRSTRNSPDIKAHPRPMATAATMAPAMTCWRFSGRTHWGRGRGLGRRLHDSTELGDRIEHRLRDLILERARARACSCAAFDR